MTLLNNLFFYLLFVLFSFESYGQLSAKQSADTKTKLIKINHAGKLAYNKSMGVEAKRLIGNVECEHEGAILRCDSAYLYDQKKMEAFGHISIVQDSVSVFGDKLIYDAKTKMANMDGNVRCIDKDMVLTTNTMVYDVGNNVASYYNGGTIINKENTLTSKNGHYYSKLKELTFHYDVVLTNPDYKMNSDTLRYNTETKTAYFIGPSIIKSKENYIYCENGWYDTDKEISRFSKHALIVTDEQKMLGDSMYYDRKNGYARATKNVQIIDTAQKTFIVGNYAEHFEKTKKSVVTNNAVFGYTVQKDTLFLSGDTLFYNQPDSLHTFVRAYKNVKFFKNDLQGMCDSINYAMHDSLMVMYNSPILWVKNGQVTAKQINLTANKNGIKHFKLLSNALVIQQADSLDADKFNQITGKNIEGFLVKDTIRKLNVIGNAQIIYYVKQKTNYKGVNKTSCSDLTVWFNADGVDRTTFRNKPESTIYPLSEIDDKEMRLKNFLWVKNKRPKTKQDILIKEVVKKK